MAIGELLQAGAGIVNMMGQKARERRALRNTEKLMGLQTRNQSELNRQGQQLQLDTWEKTSYPAQMEMLKEAGLNPGLLYGNGGPGGVTGSQGGGSASGGSAPAPQPMPMELGNAMRIGAEIALMKAQAKKAEAEANVIGTTGVPEAQTRISEAGYRMENIAAITENAKAQNALIQAETEYKQIQTETASKSMEELVNSITLNNQRLVNEITKGANEAKISSETINEAIKQIQQTTVEQSLRIALTKENITKTQEETEKIIKEQTVMITETVQKWASLSQKDQEIALQTIANAFNTSLPAKIGQWTGIIGNIIRGSASIGTSTSTVNVNK